MDVAPVLVSTAYKVLITLLLHTERPLRQRALLVGHVVAAAGESHGVQGHHVRRLLLLLLKACHGYNVLVQSMLCVPLYSAMSRAHACSASKRLISYRTRRRRRRGSAARKSRESRYTHHVSIYNVRNNRRRKDGQATSPRRIPSACQNATFGDQHGSSRQANHRSQASTNKKISAATGRVDFPARVLCKQVDKIVCK